METQEKLFKFDEDLTVLNQRLEKMRNDDPMEYEKFYSIGREIKVAAENEDLPKLQELITKHKSNIPLLRLYIVDVFQSVLHFRYLEVIQFFVERGLDLTEEPFRDCVYTMCKIAKYSFSDPPVEVLELLLKHGADPNQTGGSNFRNATLEFVKILAEKGADINAVDKKGLLPINYTQKKIKEGRNQEIYDYLISKGAVLDWRRK